MELHFNFSWVQCLYHPSFTLDEDPSVLVVGRCGVRSEVLGVFSIIDSCTGKKHSTQKLAHSILQVIPSPLTDSIKQRLHLIIDANFRAHLYPRTEYSGIQLKLFEALSGGISSRANVALRNWVTTVLTPKNCGLLFFLHGLRKLPLPQQER